MIFETFSKRLKAAKKTKPDPYKYGELPATLRNQIIHIWQTSIGPFHERGRYASYSDPSPSNQVWKFIFDTMCREAGVFSLGTSHRNLYEQCQEFIQTADVPNALDIVELSFRYIDVILRKWNQYQKQLAGITQDADDAIEELNGRFKEHNIGFRYVEGEIVRVDSEYLHQEAVVPAITLLAAADFPGAQQEFLKAHEHHKNGNEKEALNESLKALESTLKAICDLMKWSYPEKATAKPLIDLVIEKELVSKDLLAHFGGLRSALEAGVPMIRNTKGAHGQGKEIKQVPSYIAAHCLHLTAATIVLLVEAFREKKKK